MSRTGSSSWWRSASRSWHSARMWTRPRCVPHASWGRAQCRIPKSRARCARSCSLRGAMGRKRNGIDVLVVVARAAGLAVLELPDLHELVSGGRFRQMGDFWEVVHRMNKDLAKRVTARRKDFPVSEYLESARLPPARRGMLRSFVEGFYAALPERLSAKSLADEAEESEEDSLEGKQFRIANGNDGLMNWLRAGLDPERCEVRLSTVAQDVQWKRGSVSVSCRAGDGSELPPLRARAVVVTLPHAVLKEGVVKFDPAIPAKRRALGGLETGQIL